MQAEQQKPSGKHPQALLGAVPFLQLGAELDQLITETTLVTSKSPHSQKLDTSTTANSTLLMKKS